MLQSDSCIVMRNYSEVAVYLIHQIGDLLAAGLVHPAQLPITVEEVGPVVSCNFQKLLNLLFDQTALFVSGQAIILTVVKLW